MQAEHIKRQSVSQHKYDYLHSHFSPLIHKYSVCLVLILGTLRGG